MQREGQLKSEGAGCPALLQAPENFTEEIPAPHQFSTPMWQSPAVPAKAVELHFLAAACAAAGYLPEQGG